ncbi:hypothetical protein N7G274_010366 [Stereocaulon virgatum]|uniref:Wax synthase domain-containing protein n=1 Tax=Stereocaulon virgatum TaxID=373712 RepID=A0ABR3ZVL6_9LECA
MLLPDLLDVTPTSPQQVLAQYQQRFDDALATGQNTPFVYPYNAFGPYLLILYLCLPPSKSSIVYYARYPLFAIIVYLSVTAIVQCRSSMVTVGYGIGLLNAWAILWSATLIIFNDARADFKRIEEHESEAEELSGRLPNGDDQDNATGVDLSDGHAVKSRHPDGAVNQPEQMSKESIATKSRHFTWQTLPASFLHRLDWVLDVVSNFRGVRWNHQISGMAPPPPQICSTIKDPKPPEHNEQSHLTRADLIRRDLPAFIACYLVQDTLKYITLQDPYFWSLSPKTPSPFPYPRAARTLLSLIFVYTSLLIIFLLAPLVFGVLLGPKRIGQHAWPWLYAPYFGPISQVWQKGLAGLWGGWWHQVFRYAFEQAGEFAGRCTGLSEKSQLGAMLRVVVAFACSAVLHGCAAYSTLGNTKPISASFAFFMLQPVGIIGQRALSAWLKKAGVREKIPKWLRGLGNVIVVVVWCSLTGPLVADDFAATGLWLYEPVPVSFIRGLRGEGWWRWGGRWMWWYSAERWWQNGLAF